MSINIKSPREIETMRVASRIVANTLQELRRAVVPGVTTKELDRIAEGAIRRQGGDPAFPHINNFPGSLCASVNEQVVHGIPGPRRLREGEIVKLDVGAIYDGYHGDAAVTVAVGNIDPAARRLMDVTERSLALGIDLISPETHLYDIGTAIEQYVEAAGFSVVRQYFGHGLGRGLHEDPTVPHFQQPTRGIRLRPGMTFTLEPMVNAGSYETVTLADGWTVVTKDGSLSAQFEHTIVVTAKGAEVLSLSDDGDRWGLPRELANSVQ